MSYQCGWIAEHDFLERISISKMIEISKKDYYDLRCFGKWCFIWNDIFKLSKEKKIDQKELPDKLKEVGDLLERIYPGIEIDNILIDLYKEKIKITADIASKILKLSHPGFRCWAKINNEPCLVACPILIGGTCPIWKKIDCDYDMKRSLDLMKSGRFA